MKKSLLAALLALLLFASCGCAAQESGGYLLEGESGSLSVTLREEDAETGVLRLADIHAVTASGEAIDFTSTRFVPEEVR